MVRFEVAECVRRLCITGFLAIYKPGQPEQLVAAVLVCIASILLYDQCTC